MIHFEDTVCAPATSAAGAISVIRVSGPDTFRITDRLVSFVSGDTATSKGYTLKYGRIFNDPAHSEELDEVLVSVFRAPHSYTGEDSVEISCHASGYIVKSILEAFVSAGARMAEPGEFTRRAFVNGKLDLAQAEAVADLIAAGSRTAHRIAINHLKGEYSDALRSLRDKLLELTALMELELDFSEEDVEFADRSKLRTILDDSLGHIRRLSASFRDGNALRNGIPVAIVGAVNSGKSTLLNALVGDERAIVSDIPGTTRDTVEETMTIDGLLYRFIDTAGLRETEDKVEQIGIRRSLDKLSAADIVIAVLDGCADSSENSRSLSDIQARTAGHQTLIAVTNKIDISPAIEGTLGISAISGAGTDELKKLISESQARRFTLEDTVVTSARHYEALVRASESLERVRFGLDSGTPSDLVAEDLRSAINELNGIFGDSGSFSSSFAIDFQAVTDLIFSRFCIGK